MRLGYPVLRGTCVIIRIHGFGSFGEFRTTSRGSEWLDVWRAGSLRRGVFRLCREMGLYVGRKLPSSGVAIDRRGQTALHRFLLSADATQRLLECGVDELAWPKLAGAARLRGFVQYWRGDDDNQIRICPFPGPHLARVLRFKRRAPNRIECDGVRLRTFASLRHLSVHAGSGVSGDRWRSGSEP